MEDLRDRVNSLGTPRTSREQIIEYYREEFGEKDWKHVLAEDLNAARKSLDRRELKISSIMQRFQGKRLNSRISSQQQEEYSALGRKRWVPRFPPKGGYIVTGTVHILYSQCETRNIGTIYITGQDAELFARTADVQIIINLYNKINAGDPKCYTPCKEGENKLEVRASQSISSN